VWFSGEERHVQGGDSHRLGLYFEPVRVFGRRNLKAYLEEHHIAFGKTHDLVLLLGQLPSRPAVLDQQRAQIARLSQYGTTARYPGLGLDEQAAREALTVARDVRAALREELGLPPAS
jgi:HEPN domain-containing protein